MSRINVNKITGATGTASGAPITLSGDTATLSGTGVTFPAGHTIQTKYYSSQETNALSATYTVRWFTDITLVSGNSKILIIHSFNWYTANGGGWGMKVRRNKDTSYSDGTTDGTIGTSVWDLNVNNSTGPLSAYSSAAGEVYSTATFNIEDDLSASFDAGDTANYGFYYARYSSTTSVIPGGASPDNGWFNTTIMEISK